MWKGSLLGCCCTYSLVEIEQSHYRQVVSVDTPAGQLFMLLHYSYTAALLLPCCLELLHCYCSIAAAALHCTALLILLPTTSGAALCHRQTHITPTFTSQCAQPHRCMCSSPSSTCWPMTSASWAGSGFGMCCSVAGYSGICRASLPACPALPCRCIETGNKAKVRLNDIQRSMQP